MADTQPPITGTDGVDLDVSGLLNLADQTPVGMRVPVGAPKGGSRGRAVTAADLVAPAQYAPLITAAAQRHGIDVDILTAQLFQESRFNPRAVSSAGARGIAQFMPKTASSMRVNPLDPVSAIDGAARLMGENLDRYRGDYAAALSAYNIGLNSTKWGNPETLDYVAKIRDYARTIKAGKAQQQAARQEATAAQNHSLMRATENRDAEQIRSAKPAQAQHTAGAADPAFLGKGILPGLVSALRDSSGVAVGRAIEGAGDLIHAITPDGLLPEDVGGRIAAAGRDLVARHERLAEASQPDIQNRDLRAAYGGLQSTVRAVPALAAAVATRNPNVALGVMGADSGVQAYSDAKNAGRSTAQAVLHGAAYGLTEAASEKLGLGFLAEKLGKAGFARLLSGYLLRDMPSEQAATIAQKALDYATLTPEKTLGDFRSEILGDMRDTAIATAVQGGIMGGAGHAGAKLLNRGADRAAASGAPDLAGAQTQAAAPDGGNLAGSLSETDSLEETLRAAAREYHGDVPTQEPSDLRQRLGMAQPAGTPPATTSIQTTSVQPVEVPGGGMTPAVLQEQAAQRQAKADATTARQTEWEAALAELDARKQQDLDALAADGHIGRAEYDNAVMDAMSASEPVPTVMAQAFADAQQRDADPAGRRFSLNDKDEVFGAAQSNGFTPDALRTTLQSGDMGGLIDGLIDGGRVVLHADASTLPGSAPADTVVQGMTDADGTVHLVAGNLNADNATAVLLHEAFHGGGQSLLGDKAWTGLMARVNRIERAMRGGAFWRAAAESVGHANPGASLRTEEFAAYAIEHYAQAPQSIRKWVSDIMGTVQAWTQRRFGIQIGRVTPAQLHALARAALQVPAMTDRAPAASVADQKAPPFGQRQGLFQLPPIEAVTLTGLELGNGLSKKGLAQAADKLLREIQHAGVPLRNQDSGWNLVIAKVDRKKMGDNSDLSAADSKAVAAIRDLVDRAVVAETHGDARHANENVTAIHRLYAPAIIEGIAYRVKLTVKDYALNDGTQRKNLHALEAVEIESAPMGTVPPNSQASVDAVPWTAQPTSGRTFTIAELLSGAKRDGDGQSFVDDDARYSLRNPLRAGQPAGNEIAPETWTEKQIRMQANRFSRVERVEAQLRRMGIAVPAWLSPTNAEISYHGRRAERMADLRDNEVQALADAMAQNRVRPDRFDWYALARHAPEGNAHIASLEGGMPDGGSGMTNRQAADLMAGRDITMTVQTENEHGRVTARQVTVRGFSPDELARLRTVAIPFDALVEKSRQLNVEYGLESKETVDGWRQMFQHYVPLAGKAGKAEFGGAPGKQSGFSVKGGARHRTGRSSVAPNMTEQVIRQAEDAIARGESNRVAGVFVALAHSLRGNMPVAPNGKPLFERDPTDLRRYVKDGKIVQADVPAQVGRDVLIARIDGRDVPVRINDPALVESARNLDVPQMSALLERAGSLTRLLSMTYTAASPSFWPVAFLRDLQSVAVQGGRFGKGIVGGMLRPGVLSSSLGQAFRHEFTGRESPEFSAFRRDGGRTGFVQVTRELAEKRADLLGAIRAAEPGFNGPKAKSVIRRLWRYYLATGSALETGVRFAAYQSALSQGQDSASAARVAKEITLNFNRKGAGENAIRMAALYPFYNASVQGIRNTAITMQNRRVQTAMAAFGGIALLAQLALLGSMDDDERDDLMNNPAYRDDRIGNILIPTGNPERPYAKIPVPPDFSFVTATASAMTDMLYGGEGAGWRAAGSLLQGSAVAFLPPPFGDVARAVTNAPDGAGKKAAFVAATPAIAKPLAQIANNVNYLGLPLVPGRDDSITPEAYRAYRRNRTGWAAGLADWLNRSTGGNTAQSGHIDISPETILNLTRSYGGGIAGFILQGSDALTNPQKSWLDLPVIGRLSANPDALDRGRDSVVRESMDDASRLLKQYKALRIAGDAEGAAAIAQQMASTGDMQRAGAASRAQAVMTRMNRAENLLGTRSDDEAMQQRAIYEQQRKLLAQQMRKIDRAASVR